MGLKAISWVGSFAMIFLFLPSLALKIGEWFLTAPGQFKSWLIYLVAAIIVVMVVRRRWRRNKMLEVSQIDTEESLIFQAKQRLVKGEINIEEYRAIRQELKLE